MGSGGEPAPSVNTVEESELDRTETRFLYYTRVVDTLETSQKQVMELTNKAKTAPLAELDKIARQVFRRPVAKEEDREWFEKNMRSIADDNAEGLKTVKEQLDKVAPKYAELQKDERTVEAVGRRT